jgi:predicted alpha/beta superfamily hydrolase
VHKKYLVRSTIYFVLAALGLITAWVLNGIATMQGANYLTAWFSTPVDWVLSVDLLIVALAVAILMIYEANRLGMKRVWLYFLLSGITALAFTFPLFMAFRERKQLENRLASGKLERFDFDSHRVDVWVPASLHAQTPVLVMHDGRNIFDEGDSFTGKTWEVIPAIRDEVRADNPLVVAVWGLSDETRIRELSPQEILDRHPEFWDPLPAEILVNKGPVFGDSYVSLLSDAILPFVLERYEIQHDKHRTAVMGSSMGGLMSMYVMSKRPELFGTAICFSTHWPFGGNVMVDELTGMLPDGSDNRVWTDTGTIELDALYPPFHAYASEKLRAKGYAEPENLVVGTYPNTGHHESYWARRVADALNWWLKAPGRS